MGRWLLFRCRAAVERGRSGTKVQTDSRCRSPPETEGESAQRPEAGPGLTAARPRASQGGTRRRSRGSAWITPGMGGPSLQGTPVSAPTAGYGTGAGAPGLHGSAKVRTSAGRTRSPVGSGRAGPGEKRREGRERSARTERPLPAQSLRHFRLPVT